MGCRVPPPREKNPPCLSFPAAHMDGQKGCTRALRACKHPRGREAARVSGRCLHTHACERAHPHQPQQQQTRGHISVFPRARPCAIVCTLPRVCTRVCKPLFPGHLLLQSHSLVPWFLCHPSRDQAVQTHMHTRVHRRIVTHPAAVGKAPPGWGLPRRSCWVTARPSDAMSLFAYAKQHLCCGVPREEALPPAPRDPAGMLRDADTSPTHTHTPPCPGPTC